MALRRANFSAPVAAKFKSTYELEPDVKLRLATWRAQLRHQNVKATEKRIIEALVLASNVERVATLLNSSAGKENTAPSVKIALENVVKPKRKTRGKRRFR